MRITVIVVHLLLALCMLCMPEGLSPGTEDQPLIAIPTLIRQRYCYGDAEVFSVWLKLRMQYINRTGKTLILDKEIGKAWYGVKLARTLE
jgi:hypothetical protein